MEKEDLKAKVRAVYGKVALGRRGCCGSGGKASSGACCGGEAADGPSIDAGYSSEDLRAIPEGAELGLGCGNPVAMASLKPGERVLDLGSGAGVDCFLAARRVGPGGRVIGVDMTPEMVARARANATRGSYTNVDFRLGEIERLPVETASIDAVISNCVINLSTDKPAVFAEAFRVLASGGRLMVSDIVIEGELPAKLRESLEAYAGCVAGAMKKDDYLAAIEAAGFVDVRIVGESRIVPERGEGGEDGDLPLGAVKLSREEAEAAARAIVSAKVTARKP